MCRGEALSCCSAGDGELSRSCLALIAAYMVWPCFFCTHTSREPPELRTPWMFVSKRFKVFFAVRVLRSSSSFLWLLLHFTKDGTGAASKRRDPSPLLRLKCHSLWYTLGAVALYVYDVPTLWAEFLLRGEKPTVATLDLITDRQRPRHRI